MFGDRHGSGMGNTGPKSLHTQLLRPARIGSTWDRSTYYDWIHLLRRGPCVSNVWRRFCSISRSVRQARSYSSCWARTPSPSFAIRW